MLAVSRKLPLFVGVVLVFTTFILTIVATAGSTSNYSPINHVYMGEADISRINVTKVIPETGPVLSVLAGLVNSPSQNQSSGDSVASVFDALKLVANTPALKPLLQLLANSNNVSQTVAALAVVAPMMSQTSNSSSSSSQEFALIGQLVQNSQNASATLEGMALLLQSSNSSDPTIQRAVFGLLNDSQNATASVDSLATLQNQSAADKAQLMPVFSLFQQSSNATATMGALGTLMSANISADMSASLLHALQTGGSNAQATLTQVASSVPDSVRPAILAVGTLLNNTRDSNQTLSTLEGLLQRNVTSSPSAHQSFNALTSLMRYSSNQTLVLTSVATLANSTNAANAAQLTGLQEILDSSTNSSSTLNVLQTVQSSNSSSSSQDLSPVFSLLGDSKNSTATLQSVMQLMQAVQSNSTAFQPLLQILSQTQLGDTEITQTTLDTMMPMVMDNLNVNSHYRLAIFTLCRGLSDGKIQQCSSSHAVQSFVLRDILYDELEKSDFKPYMQALDVQKNDMYLEGKLQEKEKSYVPAVRAVLAFNLLTIILSFFLIILMLCVALMKDTNSKSKFCMLTGAKVLAFLVFIFALLSGAIVAAFVNIIKRDTKADDYNVMFTTGSAYAGLIWTGFALAFITFVLLFFVKVNRKKDSSHLDEDASAGATTESDEKRNAAIASDGISPHVS
ncbi:LANO_0G11540g1_1 [Lachancea nothofagi CBS 11611]|uniref:LANO_0G11540g1_1 n=1 Tax=Lachancea nothofagi CBS 11611 TaxID=1266666 RepID=A0A1G4KJE8_9SACH|nr:LANO_0G11540g1_1 [Lachancea nothofagi CBS 11611]